MAVEIKLASETANAIRLILRSPELSEGWRNVSKPLEKMMIGIVQRSDRLIEARSIDEGYQVRLTERGITLGEYL